MSVLALLLQAQRMIRDQDMGGWTDAHDAVVLDAIAEAINREQPAPDAGEWSCVEEIDEEDHTGVIAGLFFVAVVIAAVAWVMS